MSVDVYSEWRSLTWPDDASDVPVVLWALLPVPLPLVTTPKASHVPPSSRNLGKGGTSAWETFQPGQPLLRCAAAWRLSGRLDLLLP